MTKTFDLDWSLVDIFQHDLKWNGSVSSDLCIQRTILESINQKLMGLCKHAQTDTWTRPKNDLDKDFQRNGGWKAHILKIHQAVATTYAVDPNAVTAATGMKPDTVGQDDGSSPFITTNMGETISLLSAIARLDMDDIENLGSSSPDYYLYHDYHYDDTTVAPTTEASPRSMMLLSEQQQNSPQRSDRARRPLIKIKFAPKVWTEDFEICQFHTIEGSAHVFTVDENCVSMAVTCTGRFDAYFCAIMTQLLSSSPHQPQPSTQPETPEKVTDEEDPLKLDIVAPELLGGDMDMTLRRAEHGFRVYRDALGSYHITLAKYEWYVTLLTSGSLRAVQDTFHDLANEIWHGQFNKGDRLSTKRLERLLVALLGHENNMVRSQAVVFLNNLYDNHDWQQDFPFLPVVKCVGDPFVLEITINDDADARKGETPQNILLILAAPSFEVTATHEVYSYHRFEWTPSANENGSKYRRFISRRADGKHPWVGRISFGRSFPRCGFYDWRVVRCDPSIGSWEVVSSTVQELRMHFESSYSFVKHTNKASQADDKSTFRSRNLWPELGRLAEAQGDPQQRDAHQTVLPLQGRFIVHPFGARREQMHELIIDQNGCRLDENGVMTERGTFSKTAACIEQHKTKGVSALFLSGALARDNGEAMFSNSGEQTWERPDASPFAVTCRATPCPMLGGPRAFEDIIREADRVGVKILVDTCTRVSSSRPHRKYWPHILNIIDDQGKRMMLYGTSGRSVTFEESCQLNYRKVEAWDLLIEDIVAWKTRMGIHGIRIDNAHIVPQVFKPDTTELNRLDPDGQNHYSPEQRLMAEVVLPATEQQAGFWASSAAESHWPNPLLVRLCRDVWRVSKEFMIVADCGMLDPNSTRRVGVLSRSGAIPLMQSLPEMLSRVFGRRIQSDGVVTEEAPGSTAIISDWFEESHECLPEGAIAVQASCSHSSPLPALLYGRGAWAATDFLFFSSDIPSTSTGEVDGAAFRIDVVDVFDAPSSTTTHTRIPSARSMLNLVDNSKSMTSTAASTHAATTTNAMYSRARSLTKFEPITALKSLEAEQAKKLGPEFGFDLKKIGAHYEHRRALRGKFDLFSEGAMFPIEARSLDGRPLTQVFGFCRFSLDTSNFILGAINFSNEPVEDVVMDIRFLSRHYHSNRIPSNSIIEVWDLFEQDNTFEQSESKCVHKLRCGESLLDRSPPLLALRTLSEVLGETCLHKLPPFGSRCGGFKLLRGPIEHEAVTQLALYLSSLIQLERTVEQVTKVRHAGLKTLPPDLQFALESNHLASSLVAAIKQDNDVQQLAEVLERLAAAVMYRDALNEKTIVEEKADTHFDLFRLLVDSGLLSVADDQQDDSQENDDRAEMAVKLFAKFRKITELGKDNPDLDAPKKSLIEFAKTCQESNSLGPVVFMTAELGKWSTVGGLGVMVDELSTTLATEFGQETWVISPYYDRNRRGERDYLLRDGIEWAFNVTIHIGDEEVTLGVHEGKVKNVRLFFLHNAKFFPTPYPDNSPLDSVKLLAVIGKSFLEVLCHVKHIPQVVVTNDWTTGLIPAFAKHGHFGEVFKGSTFVHIIHNFDPTYEGRIFPPSRDGYQWVHGLPHDLLVDPLWSQTIVNPSRCALLTCDNWGTVSKSYRDDLRGSCGSNPSPLAPLLNRFPRPFATPNGIPIKARLTRLKNLGVESRAEAKGMIQSKYFGFEKPDLGIPIFAFIGRITSQKGVHLILEAAESVINRYNHRVQFLVGGKVNWNDPYSARCGNHMQSLKDRFPWSFYADPNEFFLDGSLVNMGADFGLMPSLFEPGGIVQQEFLVAGTPVVAFKTGGLKDTIFEFDLEAQSGNGFTFAAYHLGDFIFAIERAIRVYQDASKYTRLRKNCVESVVSCEASAAAWLGEFCRLRRRLLVNPAKVEAVAKALPAWNPEESVQRFEKKLFQVESKADLLREAIIKDDARRQVRIRYVPSNKGTRPRSVAVSGSFDDWKIRRPLAWDNSQMAFITNLSLSSGKYLFKFIVDGNWVTTDLHPVELDEEGNANNIVNV